MKKKMIIVFLLGLSSLAFAGNGEKIQAFFSEMELEQTSYVEELRGLHSDLSLWLQDNSNNEYFQLISDLQSKYGEMGFFPGEEDQEMFLVDADRLRAFELVEKTDWVPAKEALSFFEGIALMEVAIENMVYQLEILDQNQFTGLNNQKAMEVYQYFSQKDQFSCRISPWVGKTLAEGFNVDLFNFLRELKETSPDPFTLEYNRRVEGCLSHYAEQKIPVDILVDDYKEIIAAYDAASIEEGTVLSEWQKVSGLDEFSRWWYTFLSFSSITESVTFFESNPPPSQIARNILSQGFIEEISESSHILFEIESMDQSLSEAALFLSEFSNWESLNPMIYETYAGDYVRITSSSSSVRPVENLPLFPESRYSINIKKFFQSFIVLPHWARISVLSASPGVLSFMEELRSLSRLQRLYLAQQMGLSPNFMDGVIFSVIPEGLNEI